MLSYDETDELVMRQIVKLRKQLLKSAGLNASKISKRLKISHVMVSYIICGRRQTAWIRCAIVTLAGCSFDEFFGCPAPALDKVAKKKLKKLGIQIGGNG